MEAILSAVAEVFQPAVLLIIVAAAVYGIVVGSIPGLTATMAVALVVPFTFFLSDVEAIALIVTTVTCSIFAGDIPAALVRIPGTPASAAYADDAYALTRQRRYQSALGASLVFSVLGGLFGTVTLACFAPQLARFATEFTSYEYFWLYVVGLSSAAVVADQSRLKGAFALGLGLLLSTIGLGTDFSSPRLTFGFDELVTGIDFIPAMIGLFGISEVLRNVLRLDEGAPSATPAAHPEHGSLRSILQLARTRKGHLLRSSVIGSFVGMLPGAGADIAAWIAYAVSKRFSREPAAYGKGSLEGIGDAAGANNAALGSAWIPALVFGIPGDSVTAIAIGVLLMKNITPGPAIFSTSSGQAVLVFSIFVTFVVANLVLLPIGWGAIRAGAQLIRIPRRILLPIIVVFCIVGSYSLNASYFDVAVMLVMGVLGFVLERFQIPLGPVVLGIILGGPLEHRFIQCISASMAPRSFLPSPIAAVLFVIVVAMWFGPLAAWLVKRSRKPPTP